MILGHPLLGAQVAEHRVLVQIVSSHNENNCTHLCFVRKRSPRDFFSILLDLNRRLFSTVVLITAIVYFLSIFDVAFIVEGNLWLSNRGDASQHLIGLRYFVRDEWRFPLFHVPTLGYPRGTNIIFTDSIPLVALIFKILAPLVPHDFNPFGLWICVCYLLLAHAFSSLLYHFGHRSLIAAVAGGLFAVMTPFFMERLLFQHPALCGHFLVVYALVLYFKVADSQKTQRQFLLFTLLLVVALLIQIYLFAMVASIYVCAVLNAVVQPKRSWRELRISILTTVAALAATILLAGHLSQSAQLPSAEGFGYYSMNLLGPVASYYGGGFLSYGRVDATGGQYEGFNYWGAGIILLLWGGAPDLFKNVGALFSRRLCPVMLGFFALTVFALSNQVYLGQYRILSYDFPAPLGYLAEQFRSSGRFFWVVSYAVMALAVLNGLGVRRKWVATVLVLGAVGLQLADTGSIRNSLRQVANFSEERPVAREGWRPIIDAHSLIVLLPPTQCGGSHRDYAEIGRSAAESGVALHSFWAARHPMATLESCRTLNKDVLDYGFQSRVLYIVDKRTALSFRQRPDLRKFCSELGGRTVCTLQRADLNLPPLAPDRRLALWPADRRRLSSFEFTNFLGIGWSYSEGERVWALGYRSELFFRLPSCADATSLRVNLRFVGRKGRTLTMWANGGSPVTRNYSELIIEDLVIPIGVCEPDDPMVAVTFVVDKPVSTLEIGEGGDARPLGLHLMEIELLL